MARPAPAPAWPDVRYALWLYVVLLAVQAIGVILHALDAGLVTVLGVEDVLLALAAVASAPRLGADLVGLYRRAGFGIAGYLLIFAASYPIAAGVAFVASHLERAFDVAEKDVFGGLGVGLSFLFLCVTPPIFEELVFRGTVFGLLRRHFSLRDALIASSFAFAMMHLSVPTLLTHVPLGLWLGFLRARGDSLWPGMFAHFLHNGWVLLDLHVKVLPG